MKCRVIVGMDTKHWGPALWQALFDIGAGFDVNPNKDKHQRYKQFFNSLGDVLPCKYCRETYGQFLDELGGFDLYANKGENGLIELVYRLKCRVNEKLTTHDREEYERLQEAIAAEQWPAHLTRAALAEARSMYLRPRPNPSLDAVIQRVLQNRVSN